MAPLKILVSGRISATPGQGGAAWAVLQYVVGLAQLGHHVAFVEAIDPAAVTPPSAPLARSTNAAYLADALSPRPVGWWLYPAGGDSKDGVGSLPIARGGTWDLLVNLSGCLRDEELMSTARQRMYVDLDPGFTQVWHAQGVDVGLDLHSVFATVGAGVGADPPRIPTCERQWIRTLPPVVLSEWTAGHPITRPAMTTVANWRSYGSVTHGGRHYGQRAHSFRQFFTLPAVSPLAIELALGIDDGESGDLAELGANGWTLIDPVTVAGSPAAYQTFVRTSLGELSIAKSGYVESGSGWFSDRSACYLASGRPVVAQDTGFGSRLPVGAGLLVFSCVDEAAEALRSVEGDYLRHSAAARRIAELELDSAVVLRTLLASAGFDGD